MISSYWENSCCSFNPHNPCRGHQIFHFLIKVTIPLCKLLRLDCFTDVMWQCDEWKLPPPRCHGRSTCQDLLCHYGVLRSIFWKEFGNGMVQKDTLAVGCLLFKNIFKKRIFFMKPQKQDDGVLKESIFSVHVKVHKVKNMLMHLDL